MIKRVRIKTTVKTTEKKLRAAFVSISERLEELAEVKMQIAHEISHATSPLHVGDRFKVSGNKNARYRDYYCRTYTAQDEFQCVGISSHASATTYPSYMIEAARILKNGNLSARRFLFTREYRFRITSTEESRS